METGAGEEQVRVASGTFETTSEAQCIFLLTENVSSLPQSVFFSMNSNSIHDCLHI